MNLRTHSRAAGTTSPINSIRHHALIAVALAAIPLLLAPAVGHANVMYTYTGNDFTDNFQANPPPSPGYTRVTGTITVASPFAASGGDSNPADILAWSFSDGVDSLNNMNSTIITGAVGFGFATNAAGHIDQWIFEVGNVTTTAEITTVNAGSVLQLDEGTGDSSDPGAPGGSNFNEPGNWMLTSSPVGGGGTPTGVPEPTTLSLLAASLGAFWLARRRRPDATSDRTRARNACVS